MKHSLSFPLLNLQAIALYKKINNSVYRAYNPSLTTRGTNCVEHLGITQYGSAPPSQKNISAAKQHTAKILKVAFFPQKPMKFSNRH